MFGGTVKVRMRFHKFVLCRHCKCAYRLGSARKFVARGSTEDDARSRAEWKAEQDWSDVPPGPCPHCFRTPPELAAKSLASNAGLILVLTGGTLGMLLGLKYILTDSQQTPPVEGFGAFASVIGLIATLFCAWRVARHPDRDLALNRRRAEDALERGAVVIVRPGRTPAEEVRPPRVLLRAATVLTVGWLAALPFNAAALYRLANGLESHSRMYPPVVGPGDEVLIRFDETINNVDMYWVGQVAVAELEGPEPGAQPVPLVATTHQQLWDRDKIMTRGGGDGNLWVKVRLPGDPSRAGKTVRVHLVMDVSYPTAVGGGFFQTAQKRVEKTVTLKLGAPRTAATYRRADSYGPFVGFIVLVGMLAVLTVMAALGASVRTPVTHEPVSCDVKKPDDAEADGYEPPPWAHGGG